MWIFNRVLPFRTKLIIGCGLNHEHYGVHVKADTVDIDRTMDPDIIGSITDEVMNHSLFRKYKFILLECLPQNVYANRMLYDNLNFLRSPKSTIVFLSLNEVAFAQINHSVIPYGWQARVMTEFEDVPPQLCEDDMYSNYIKALIRESPFPSLIISSL